MPRPDIHGQKYMVKAAKLGWQYTGGFSAGFYGTLRFNAFSYLDIVDTRLQETPDSEYPNFLCECKGM